MTARRPPSSVPATHATSSSHGSLDQNSFTQQQQRRLQYLEKILRSRIGSEVPLDLDSLRSLAEEADSQQSPSASSHEDEVDKSITMQSLDGNVTHYSGEFSHWNFSMRIKDWLDQSVARHGQNEKTPKPSIVFDEYYRPDELRSPAGSLVPLSSLPPRSITDFLIHCFFQHAEANYSFVDREWLCIQVGIVYENPMSLSNSDIGTISMIFAILAIGTQYAYLESMTEGRTTIDATESKQFTEDAVGIQFYRKAAHLLPEVIAASSLESVQACLLMGIYTLPVDASGLAYIYLNLALKLAVQNGMHRKHPANDIDARVRETRNRVWWALYTIEQRVGIFHGRPISIASVDVDADLPSALLGPTWSFRNPELLLTTIQLNQYLSKVAHIMTNLRTLPKPEKSDCVKKLAQLQCELVEWWEGHGDTAFCNSEQPRSGAFRPKMHMRLEYCMVRMFLGRIFILPQDGPLDSGNRSTPSSDMTSRSPRSTLVRDCVEAALSVVDACRIIARSVGLARASYTEFSSCRAALLVITTQCLTQNTDRFRQALRDGVVMLKDMSSGSQSWHSEASLIEAFERAIASMKKTRHTETADSGESDYAKFKKWEQTVQMHPSAPGSAGSAMASDTATPLAAGQGWRPAEAAWREDNMLMPSCTPFFGVDGNFASFPESLDELPSFLDTNF
ncbi:C6 transcription factor (PrnA) [Cordyceps javanica]|uniref:C6 transcription factor (PrnA) n=1 Tax=Cordyceps javanica TaxID=43265 RepID=A0A545UUX8_9HYPO|nr:C6 transcription factor (PrnA) [Cordyceps javanica]TQW05374.1 C6 transcription factor (PrnA) [Cordyceps javanica]